MVRPHSTLSLQSMGKDCVAISPIFRRIVCLCDPATIVEIMVSFGRMALASVIAVGLIGVGSKNGFAASVASWPDVQEPIQATTPQTGADDSSVTALAINRNAEERPLPDIPTLMHEVETNQRASEKIEKDYMYRRCRRTAVGRAWRREEDRD